MKRAALLIAIALLAGGCAHGLSIGSGAGTCARPAPGAVAVCVAAQDGVDPQ